MLSMRCSRLRMRMPCRLAVRDVLYYTILYYTILYYTILYYTIPIIQHYTIHRLKCAVMFVWSVSGCLGTCVITGAKLALDILIHSRSTGRITIHT